VGERYKVYRVDCLNSLPCENLREKRPFPNAAPQHITMFSSCRSSSPDFTPPPTPIFSSAEMPEYDSATSAMEIDFEHSGSQLGTDISYNGAPDKESIQPTDCDRVTKIVTTGCDFPGCLPRPGTRMAESPSPLQRFLGEEENRVPSLVQYNIPPNATAGLDKPSTRVNRGKRDGRRRKRRARRASSKHVEIEPLSVRDRIERDFGE